MSTWTEDRLADFEAYYAEWPEAVSRNGVEKRCIKTPDSMYRPLQVTHLENMVQATFDMLKEDFDTIGLRPTDSKPRPQFQCNGITWTIHRVGDDSPVDPIIQFWANRKQ